MSLYPIDTGGVTNPMSSDLNGAGYSISYINNINCSTINGYNPFPNASALASYSSITGFDGGGNLRNAPNPNFNGGFGITFKLDSVDSNSGLALRDYNKLVISANGYMDTNDSANNSVCIISYEVDGNFLNPQGTIGQYVYQPARTGGDDVATYRYLNGTIIITKGVNYTPQTTYLYVWFSQSPGYPNSRLGWWGLNVSINPSQ